MAAGRIADAAEVEAQRGEPTACADLHDTGDDRAVHVAPIQRMWMADDDPDARFGRDGQAGFERLGAGRDGRRPLGYHVAVMRITARGLTVQPAC